MAIEGVDYAWARPNIGQLIAAGKRFACRYGGPGSSGKQLDPGEAQALTAARIAMVSNAEGAADGLLGGWSAGVAWARDAEAHFLGCGMPPGRPIYLSVDFDVQSGQWPAVAQALQGAASVIGSARVGVYGGRRAIEWARRDGVARWFWQTYAWSGGVWVGGNHIEQYRNQVSLGGGIVDLNRALPADFGQWMIGDDMAFIEQHDWDHLRWRVFDALVAGHASAAGPADLIGQPIWIVRFLSALDAKVSAIAQSVGVAPEQLEQLSEAVEAASLTRAFESQQQLAAVLTETLIEEGLTPVQAEAIADRAVRRALRVAGVADLANAAETADAAAGSPGVAP